MGQLFRALYVRFVLLMTAPKWDNFFGLFRFNLLLAAPKWDKCSGFFMFVSFCNRLFQRGLFQGSLCLFRLATDRSKMKQLLRALYVRFVFLLTAPKWDNCSGLFMFVFLATNRFKVGQLFWVFLFVLCCC